MDVFFINLADQTERRNAVEANFQASNDCGWRLHRIEAVTARDVADVTGPIRPGEKGCFLSHARAIAQSQNSDGHVLIAEDDIQFGKRSFQTIDTLLASVPKDSWDIIYTDVIFPDPHTMIDAFTQRRRDGGRTTLVNLREARFAGSTAYVVNRSAKNRVLDLIAPQGNLDQPYDLHLRRLIVTGALRAFLIFPFATTVSMLGDSSGIQTDDSRQAEHLWNSFRRLMWAERDMEQAGADAGRIFAQVQDAETETFSRLLAGLLAPGFKRKQI